jgi:glycosyltransferase involved in cell wall biosynthesis
VADPRVLTLFLTSGKSLVWWESEGVFSREILLYLEFLRSDAFDRVQIFSYDARDRAFVAERIATEPLFARVDVLAPKSGKGGAGWGVRGVMAHRAAIARSAVLKTNQISGAWAAILAAKLTGRPLVLRMGYVLSRRFALNGQKAKAAVAAAVERVGCAVAARIVVTSQDAADRFSADPSVASKVRLMPTYVDVDTFTARGALDFDAPLIAVGRMRPQKNLPALFRACALAGVDLVLVGKGEQESALRALAATLPVTINFAGTLDNVALAHKLGEHSIFILPSLHEGLPKVLIEAMASGLVCVASRIPGITDLIEDGINGYLIDGFDADAIAAAIRRAQSERNAALGLAARAKVEARFGLKTYAAAEAAIMAELA